MRVVEQQPVRLERRMDRVVAIAQELLLERHGLTAEINGLLATDNENMTPQEQAALGLSVMSDSTKLSDVAVRERR